MSTKFYIDRSRSARRMTKQGSDGHITLHDNGRAYSGLGVKDLKRRLDHWEGRVADFAAMSAEAKGTAKAAATKLVKSGEKLINTIRDQIAEREAA